MGLLNIIVFECSHIVIHFSHSAVYLATFSRSFEGAFQGLFENIPGLPGDHLEGFEGHLGEGTLPKNQESKRRLPKS